MDQPKQISPLFIRFVKPLQTVKINYLIAFYPRWFAFVTRTIEQGVYNAHD
ncbi:MAG: hypothetical protein U0X91_25935 [Spirosomataceae bacterium]